MLVYGYYSKMNILTHDVVNNIAMTVYPFPSSIPSIIIRSLSLILARTRFFAMASRKPLKWVEEEFMQALNACARRPTLAELVPQARADLKAAFKHVQTLRKEEEGVIAVWEGQVSRTLGQHTPFFKPANWGHHRFYRWFDRVQYSLTFFGMPNYRGPTVDDLVLELGALLAILPRGPDGRVYDEGDKFQALLENHPPQYLVRKMVFHRLTQASIKRRMTEVNSRSPSVDVGTIPSTKVPDITKAYKNYAPGKEPQHAPIHTLDLAYAKLRETVPAIEETLHPRIKGALVVDLHEARVIPPRSSSEKRSRDPSAGSTETAHKKGKSGNGVQTSQTASRGKSQPPRGRARSSSKGRQTPQRGKPAPRGGAQGGQGRQGQQSSSSGGERGRRPTRTRVGQGRFKKGW